MTLKVKREQLGKVPSADARLQMHTNAQIHTWIHTVTYTKHPRTNPMSQCLPPLWIHIVTYTKHPRTNPVSQCSPHSGHPLCQDDQSPELPCQWQRFFDPVPVYCGTNSKRGLLQTGRPSLQSEHAKCPQDRDPLVQTGCILLDSAYVRCLINDHNGVCSIYRSCCLECMLFASYASSEI